MTRIRTSPGEVLREEFMVPLNLGKSDGAPSACTPQHVLVRFCVSIGRANSLNQILCSKNLPRMIIAIL